MVEQMPELMGQIEQKIVNIGCGKTRKITVKNYRVVHPIPEVGAMQDTVEEFGSELMDDVEPTWSWENDGIGSYEYWGFRGYDKGRNYVLVEGNVDTEVLLTVDVTEMTSEQRFELAEKLMKSKTITGKINHQREYDDFDTEIFARMTVTFNMHTQTKWDKVQRVDMVVEFEWDAN